jgi:hypothetical protein
MGLLLRTPPATGLWVRAFPSGRTLAPRPRCTLITRPRRIRRYLIIRPRQCPRYESGLTAQFPATTPVPMARSTEGPEHSARPAPCRSADRARSAPRRSAPPGRIKAQEPGDGQPPSRRDLPGQGLILSRWGSTHLLATPPRVMTLRAMTLGVMTLGVMTLRAMTLRPTPGSVTTGRVLGGRVLGGRVLGGRVLGGTVPDGRIPDGRVLAGKAPRRTPGHRPTRHRAAATRRGHTPRAVQHLDRRAALWHQPAPLH